MSFLARPIAMVACVLVIVAGCGQSSRTSAPPPTSGGSTYTLVQMNLCLSGIATCYGLVAYPAGVREATSVIRRTRPDAVTFSEACRGDIARIAVRTGYHVAFEGVLYRGKPLECVDPGSRGLFGDAVITRAAIVGSASRPFTSQAGIEQRGWLCVATRIGVEVCTAHLNSRSPAEIAGNDGQCAELGAVLGRRGAGLTLVFGGDLNRHSSCAPRGFWTRTDASAGQDPGSQQVYGNAGLVPASLRVLPFAHSDHDVMVVRARRTG